MANVNDPMKTINNEREFNTASLKSRISILLRKQSNDHRRVNKERTKKDKQIDIHAHNANIINKLTKANILEYLNSINHTKEMDKTLHALKLLKRSVEKTKMPLPPFDVSACSNGHNSTQSKPVNNKHSFKDSCKYITRNKKIFDIIPITKIKEKGSCNFLPNVYTAHNTCSEDININNEPKTIQTETTHYISKNSPNSQSRKLKLKRTKDNKILNINFLLDYQKDKAHSQCNHNNNNTIHTSHKENPINNRHEQYKLGKSIYAKNIRNVKYKIRLTKNNFFGDTLQEFDDSRIADQKNQRNKSRMLSTEFPTRLYNYNYLYSTNKSNLNTAHAHIASLEKSIFSHYDTMREQVNNAKPHYL